MDEPEPLSSPADIYARALHPFAEQEAPAPCGQPGRAWQTTVTYRASLRAGLRRWTLDCTLRLAEKQVVLGLPVGVLWPDDEERRVIFPKIEEALALVGHYDPRRLGRFQNDVSAI